MRPILPDIDNDLLSRIREGDEPALRVLYDELYRPLLFFAEGLIHDLAQAEDIVVDAFTGFWERRTAFYQVAAVKSFLYVSVRNACYKHYNRMVMQNRHHDAIQATLLENEDFIESRIVIAEMVHEIHREIEQLNPKYREVIQLIFVEGLSIKEIAAKVQTTTDNVRKRKERAVELLRNRLIGSSLSHLALISLIIGQKLS